MASDSSPSSHEGKKRKKRKEREEKKTSSGAEVQVAIEELTASGHTALQRGDCDEALNCFKKAFKTSIELKDTKVQRACAFNLGAAYVEAGKPQKGLDFLRRAQPGERGERVADLQFNLAVAHQALRETGKAAGYYLQAAQLYRSQGDGATEGDTCMKMALCHLRLQEWTQAAQSYQRAGESYRVAGRLNSAAIALKEAGNHMLQSDQFTTDDIIGVLSESLELSDNIKEPEALGNLYNDLGLSFSQLKRFQDAAGCYQRAVSLLHSVPGQLAVVLQNLGAAYNSLSQFQLALNYHRQAASLHGSLGSRRAQGRCFSNLAFAHSELGEVEEAAENYLHALQAFKDTDDYKGQCQACEGLGEAHFKLRDLEKATQYYKQALAVLAQCKDSSSSVPDRLVNKLSEALQHKLSLTTPGRLQRGPGHWHPNRNRIPPRQPVRKTDINGSRTGPNLQSHGMDLSQSPHHIPNGHRVTGGAGSVEVCEDRGREEGGASGPDGEQVPRNVLQEAGDSESTLRGTSSEQPGYLTMLPGANRNLNNTYEQPEPHYQNNALSDEHGLTQQSEHLYESIKPKTTHIDSERSQAPDSEVAPLGSSDNAEETTTLLKKWKSRICALM